VRLAGIGQLAFVPRSGGPETERRSRAQSPEEAAEIRKDGGSPGGRTGSDGEEARGGSRTHFPQRSPAEPELRLTEPQKEGSRSRRRRRRSERAQIGGRSEGPEGNGSRVRLAEISRTGARRSSLRRDHPNRDPIEVSLWWKARPGPQRSSLRRATRPEPTGAQKASAGTGPGTNRGSHALARPDQPGGDASPQPRALEVEARDSEGWRRRQPSLLSSLHRFAGPADRRDRIVRGRTA
jgi:hypothetical protein